MKIVIDIEEGRYNWIMSHASNDPGDYADTGDIVFRKAVESGTVLPKRHGRLIDADDLIQDIIDDSQPCIFNSECERIVHDKMVEFAVDRITEASTIIESDRAESGE